MNGVSQSIKQLVSERIKTIGESVILTEIDDAKLEYVDDDWDEQFDTLDEAYAEQGRGEAESDVCEEHAYAVLGSSAEDDDVISFKKEMADQLGVLLN